MNILYVCQRIPYPPNKGEKLRSFHQIEFLCARGHNVQVFSPIHEEQEIEWRNALEKKLAIDTHSLPIKYPHVHLVRALLTGKALSVGKFFRQDLQNLFDSVIQQSQFDIIVFSASSLADYWFSSRAINTLQHKPILAMDFMDVDSDKWRQYASESGILTKWIYRREQKLISKLERSVIREFDLCMLISDKEVALMRSQNANCIKSNDIVAVGNGIDMLEFSLKPVISPKLDHFLFVGVMDYKPNIDAVLFFTQNLWPTIKAQNNSAKFSIVGMSPTPAILSLAKQDGIEVTGMVDSVVDYFHQADVFVATFQIARGVQNKILQAMACGVPVIASELGAEGIPCEHGKNILLSQLTKESFIEQLNTLKDWDTHQAIINNAFTLIETEYSWPGMLSSVEQSMTTLVAELESNIEGTAE